MRFQKDCAVQLVEKVWMEMNETVRKLLKITRMCAFVETVEMTPMS